MLKVIQKIIKNIKKINISYRSIGQLLCIILIRYIFFHPFIIDNNLKKFDNIIIMSHRI